MAGFIWSQNDDLILEKSYYSFSKEQLEKLFPNRTWDAIKIHARKLGLNRNSNLLANTNPSVLLLEIPEAYYWIGFLLADGHFSGKRLKLALSKKDYEQIKKFADFISLRQINEDSVSYNISIQHDSIYELIKKFKISNKKTNNPPDFRNIKGDLFLALLIGFIDGDGSIQYQTNRKDCQLSIQIHNSWLETLNFFSLNLHSLIGIPYQKAIINSRGYAYLNISNSIVLKFIKRNALRLNLPIMERKWNKINLNIISKRELGQYRTNQVQVLLNKNLSKNEIAHILGISNSAITEIIKRNNLNAYKGKLRKEVYDK